MNSIWNNNISLFRTRFPSLAEYYKNIFVEEFPKEELPWQVSTAKSGVPTAVDHSLHLHSSYNPVREAQNAVAQKAIEEKGTTIFLGFGLGYPVIEWAKIYKNKKLILIEPSPLHFFASLSLLDWTEVFSIQNLIIAIDCPLDNIMSLLEDPTKINIGNTGVSDSYIFKNQAFTIHNQEYFDSVSSLIERNKRKNEINAATYKKFGRLWTNNSNKNLHQMEKLEGVSKIAEKISQTSVPFLLVAAGPSLEKILPHIKELKKRTIIVCVETALRSLIRYNVQPDFIILTDPQYWAYKHIEGYHAKDSILITEISAYPAVFNFDCKQIVLCSSQFFTGQEYEKTHNLHLGDLGAGGSVASSAWNFAKLCGAKEIFTCGLDLSFPNKQTHIKGSSAEQTFHTKSNRLHSSEHSNISSLFSANAQMGFDYHGNPVLTDSRMKMFAWWFESRLANCPETTTYTLCPEGLKIPGIKPFSVDELLEKPEITKNF